MSVPRFGETEAEPFDKLEPTPPHPVYYLREREKERERREREREREREGERRRGAGRRKQRVYEWFRV